MRDATPEDIEAIGALRESVGWNVHRWALLDAMRAPHARFFLALDAEGRLVGAGSGIGYGALGVVGNMVVAAEHRRRGLGAAILERVMDFLEDERSCTTLELTATQAGRPLYARYGFGVVGATARAEIPASAASALGKADAIRGPTRSPVEATTEDLEELTAYDATRFGGDRGPNLAAAIDDRGRAVLVQRRGGGAIRGYLVARDGTDRIGPWLADGEADAAALLREALARRATPQAATVVLPAANERGVAWLAGLGASVDRWEGFMRRGPPVARRVETIYATAVGALG
jgi:GNAT superfamily N-acetyltransferase